MIKPKVKFIGAKPFINRMNKLANTLQSDLNKMVLYEGETTFKKSQRDVPVLTGDLSRTGKLNNTYNNKVLVSEVSYGGLGVRYAPYKEFGTGEKTRGKGGLNLSGDYQEFELYAKQFEVTNKTKKIVTRSKRFLFSNFILSRRNLMRKINTLSKKM